MAKAKFMCLDKTGVETFTVHLEPVAEAVSPACTVCGKTTHEDFCQGVPGALHPITEMKSGDTTFFKDLPNASIFLSVLTPEAAAEFVPGEVTIISFEREVKDKLVSG